MTKKNKYTKIKSGNLLKGIAIGAPLGTFLGWIAFNNIALGVAFGTAIGAAIGSVLDEK